MLLSGAVASNVVEVGIGKNAGQDLMAVFAGQCVGVKTGVSAGGSVNLFGWKNISSIPGESHAFTIGVDVPMTEIGVSFTVVRDKDLNELGMGLSFGVGVGDPSPIEVEYHKCNTLELKVFDYEEIKEEGGGSVGKNFCIAFEYPVLQ